MTLSTYIATALVALYAPLVQADIGPHNASPFPFPKDNINATVTVNFDGYDVTEPFSNSSEANTPWQAQVKIRGPVRVDESSEDFDPDDEPDNIFDISVAEISLTYNLEDSDYVEDPDDSWGYCAGTQILFNVSTEADESINPSCEGVLDQECIDWLQDYVDRGGPCEGFGNVLIHEDIANGPCSKDHFPEPSVMGPGEVDVPQWTTLNSSALSDMKQQYTSNGPEDDTDEYDALVTQIFVLLVSWGERNSSNSVAADPKSVLNGTVLCLRANETAEGSRSIEEIVEDGAAMVGGGRGLAIALAALTVVMTVGF